MAKVATMGEGVIKWKKIVREHTILATLLRYNLFVNRRLHDGLEEGNTLYLVMGVE